MDFSKITIYQIYPKSFYDSNGDGIGDLRGITKKLDYIKELGCEMIWITPFFKSPQRDNGYDIADYMSIEPMYGDFNDFDELVKKADSLGIGIMLDMVFNHTSTEHEWFQKALAGDKEYMDYYYFFDGAPDTPPTNWQSKFGGSAWEYVPKLKKWYLHLFDKTQADLNWENPKVRNELKKVLAFWKGKGVKGFRFDVINLVSKPQQFIDDDSGDGRRFYTDGPKIHEYLKELHAEGGLDDVVTVGEMSSTSIENCIRYTNPEEKELDMSFSFHHLKVDYKNGDKWQLQSVDYRKLKDILQSWQLKMSKHGGWNALFFSNHDQPRTVSRFGDDENYHYQSATMLAALMYLMRGTPYIYQGEEIGLKNAGFTEIKSYRDVESLNYFEILKQKGTLKDEALHIISERSRDNGRTPMQWTEGENSGFTCGTPWISLSVKKKGDCAEKQRKDENSIFNFFKTLCKLRREKEVISKGNIEFLLSERNDIFCYKRTLDEKSLLVVCNLTDKEIKADLSAELNNMRLVLSNYKDSDLAATKTLRPYQTAIYEI